MAEVQAKRALHPQLSVDELFSLIEAEHGPLEAASIKVDAFEESSQSSTENIPDFDPALFNEFPPGSLSDPAEMRRWLARIQQKANRQVYGIQTPARVQAAHGNAPAKSRAYTTAQPHGLWGEETDAMVEAIASAHEAAIIERAKMS